jgi:hypothetical protein
MTGIRPPSPLDRRFRDVARNGSVRTGVRTSGPFASPRLVALAKESAGSWSPEGGFARPVEGLGEPGYDDALDAIGGHLSDAFGDDIVTFVADLKNEAMRGLREEPGRPSLCATLFALPVEGSASAVECLSEDRVRLADLAGSLVREGVAAPGSRVLFLPGGITPGRMLLAMPGRIRQALSAFLDACAESPSGTVLQAAAAARVHALLGSAVPGRPAVPRSVGRMEGRVLLGVRVVAADADGDFPIDFFSAFVPAAVAAAALAAGDPQEAGIDGPYGPPADAEAAPELSLWLSEANAALAKDGLTLSLPDRWAAATAVLACTHLQRTLSVLMAAGGRARSPVDEILVHRTAETVSVGLVVEGALVGPVHVPRCLVSGDPEQLDHALSAYAAPIVDRDGPDPFALAA